MNSTLNNTNFTSISLMAQYTTHMYV